MKTTMARCYLALLAFVATATAAECPTGADQDGVITLLMDPDDLDLYDNIRTDSPLHSDNELPGSCCLLVEIRSFMNDSEITFSMSGEDVNGGTVTQSVTGGHESTVTFSTPVRKILALSRDAESEGPIEVGYTVATCDVLV